MSHSTEAGVLCAEWDIDGKAPAGGRLQSSRRPDFISMRSREMRPLAGRVPNQLFSSELIFLTKSSYEVSPLIFSPLMKKVGVESTLSMSLAYF